jgi:hypothetical protein
MFCLFWRKLSWGKRISKNTTFNRSWRLRINHNFQQINVLYLINLAVVNSLQNSIAVQVFVLFVNCSDEKQNQKKHLQK